MSTADPQAPVRVAVLGDALAGGGGMGRYAREVLRELGRRDDVEVVVVAPGEALAVLGSIGLGSVETIRVPARGQVAIALWERYVLGRRLRGVQVVHGTKHLLPRCRLPTVLTVHDILAITAPEQFDLVKRALLPRQYRRVISEATVLHATSETTKRKLIALDPPLAAKTFVVPNAVTLDLLTVDACPVPGLENRDFALVVGDLSPRKNVSLLLDIWERPEGPPAGLTLVVVGPEGVRSGAVINRLEEMETRGTVVWARHIDDAELRYCYERARVVLAPSIEEGFGLPVVEALALGAPVVASRDDALVEVGQGLPVHVDADDADGWAKAIEVVATSGAERVAHPPRFTSWEEKREADDRPVPPRDRRVRCVRRVRRVRRSGSGRADRRDGRPRLPPDARGYRTPDGEAGEGGRARRLRRRGARAAIRPRVAADGTGRRGQGRAVRSDGPGEARREARAGVARGVASAPPRPHRRAATARLSRLRDERGGGRARAPCGQRLGDRR